LALSWTHPRPKSPRPPPICCPNPESYTCKLLAGGDNKILKKVGEECAEVVMAFKDDVADEIAGEVADLFYHVLVGLAHHNVDIRDVYRKLQSRRK
jgi:phosphoribosyl-AMP cyclohydrolase / phosphoribosyl-ATP pyrophosphohydrolase